jgi:hypothetical protein
MWHVITIICFNVLTTTYFVERGNRIMSGGMQKNASQEKTRMDVLELLGTKMTGAIGSLIE